MTTAAIHDAWWKVVRFSGNMLFFGTNNRIRAEDQGEAFKLLPLMQQACKPQGSMTTFSRKAVPTNESKPHLIHDNFGEG
jgi:hypothetical protein